MAKSSSRPRDQIHLSLLRCSCPLHQTTQKEIITNTKNSIIKKRTNQPACPLLIFIILSYSLLLTPYSLSKPLLQRHIKSRLTHIIIRCHIQPFSKPTPIWLIINLKRYLIIRKRIKSISIICYLQPVICYL